MGLAGPRGLGQPQLSAGLFSDLSHRGTAPAGVASGWASPSPSPPLPQREPGPRAHALPCAGLSPQESAF